MNALAWLGMIFSLLGALASLWFVLVPFYTRGRVTWRQARKGIERILAEMRRRQYQPSLIIGSGRGGAIVAAWLSGGFGHVPIMAVDFTFAWNEVGRQARLHTGLEPTTIADQDVLIVTGETLSGASIQLLRENLAAHRPREIKVAALYCHPESRAVVDFQGIISTRPHVKMPWMLDTYEADAKKPLR